MSYQQLVLFRRLPSQEWLSARGDGLPFRATAQFISGEFEGMGLISMAGRALVDVHNIRLDLNRTIGGSAGRGSKSALDLGPIPVLPLPHPIPPSPPLSGFPPFPNICFSFIQVAPGQMETFGLHLAERGGDVQFAAGLLIGPKQFNVCIEVVGDSGVDTNAAVHALTHHSSVVSAHHCHTTGELTTGFGTPVAD